MKKILLFVYGAVSYLLFLATFVYLIGFLANIGVSRSIDTGPESPLHLAILVNVALLALFGLQHSGMARLGFKKIITRILPKEAERSTYVLMSCVALALVCHLWEPIKDPIWTVSADAPRWLLMGLYMTGVGIVLYTTFLIDHFDLFGLRQVMLPLRGKPYTERDFVTPSLYRIVRHPLYVGWIIVFFATPTMSGGRLLFAAGCTGYILIAIVLEERDLVRVFGRRYLDYMGRTPRLLPVPKGLFSRLEGRDVGDAGATR